ncbi:hypothetical protein [Paenibacillus elgii]|uniref:hypothetical protein n=1 Tax=Paenibacillus elgii TaxID=189691 RepID=UPI000FD6E41B|nr:hypothetical protein [Paenibacillus elgii]NEN84350.1 hypothetical protein [Paenibacillus elgii]
MAYNAKTNWQFDETVTESDLNRIEQGIKDVYTECLTSSQPQEIVLNAGVQIVDSKTIAPLTDIRIRGRMLINLLGRDGGCEVASRIASYKATVVLDSTKKISGYFSAKVTATDATGESVAGTAMAIKLQKDKSYLLRGWVYNETCPNTRLYYGNTAQWVETSIQGKWVFLYKKFRPSIDVTGVQGLISPRATSAGQTAYMDEIAIYEISSAEFDEIDSMTPEQVAARWPYVDDAKSLYGPYVEKYGKNVLPPFEQWNLSVGYTVGNIQSDGYKLTFTKPVTGYAARSFGFRTKPGEVYTFSVNVDVENIAGNPNVGAYYQILPYDIDGVLLQPSLHGPPYAPSNGHHIFCKTFTVPLNAVRIVINVGVENNVTGKFTFSNPMLNVGVEKLLFTDENKMERIIFGGVRLASNVDGSVYDSLYFKNGKFWKNIRINTTSLTGDLNWRSEERYAGYTWLRTDNNFLASPMRDAGYLIDPDGGSMERGKQGIAPVAGQFVVLDSSDINRNSVLLSVADSISGWGGQYKPSKEEIKAYFYGWQLRDMAGNVWDGSDKYDNKRWYAKWSPGAAWAPVGGNEYTKLTVPTEPAPGYRPHLLIYQLANAAYEEVRYEGSVTLHEGQNRILFGEGALTRERVRPLLGDPGVYRFNNTYIGDSRLGWTALRFFEIYKNGLVDGSWQIREELDADHAHGKVWASIPSLFYDPANVYSVTYETIDKWALTPSIVHASAHSPANAKSVVDALVAEHSGMAARVGSIENAFALRQQMRWITPSLLNGWVNYENAFSLVGYYKDSTGVVHIRGLIRAGAIGKAVFRLPPGYRPAYTLIIATCTDEGGQFKPGRVDVDWMGYVSVAIGSNGYVSLDNISFLAEN